MLEKAKALAPELVRLRRDIHRHPELSFQEVRTAKLVADTLTEIGGISVRTGIAKTGVVGEMGSGTGPTIAIRADMDALPIVEKTEAAYASTHEGVMHACGHDAHTAILLGVAHLLKESFAQDGLQGNVRFIFQPAEEQEDEEGKSGGLRMVEENMMAGVDAIIALHVDATEPVGTVSSQAGWNSAAVDSFHAWITAAGGHGAYPHEAPDPLWMLSPVLTALHGIVSRRIDPAQPAVVSLGQIHGGTASNIIPAEVYLNGTLRSYDEQVRSQLIVEVERALSIVRPLGGDYRLKVIKGYPAGWNDPTVNSWLTGLSREFLGPDAVREETMGMGAEDFAYMSQVVPGAMIMIGAAIPDGVARHHHTNIFDIDESVLPFGAAILAETARRFLAGEISLG
jgi:amidohydrolase